jgi:hypothetical protein
MSGVRCNGWPGLNVSSEAQLGYGYMCYTKHKDLLPFLICFPRYLAGIPLAPPMLPWVLNVVQK